MKFADLLQRFRRAGLRRKNYVPQILQTIANLPLQEQGAFLGLKEHIKRTTAAIPCQGTTRCSITRARGEPTGSSGGKTQCQLPFTCCSFDLFLLKNSNEFQHFFHLVRKVPSLLVFRRWLNLFSPLPNIILTLKSHHLYYYFYKLILLSGGYHGAPGRLMCSGGSCESSEAPHRSKRKQGDKLDEKKSGSAG